VEEVITMERILITIGCLLLAGWQLYVSYGELRRLKTKGNKNTSAFASFAIFYSIAFGVISLGLGLQVWFHLI
jgi:hypothetical protein